MPVLSTGAGLPGPSDDRRADGRLTVYGFPLASPGEACIVDCSRGGIGIESASGLPVGSLTEVGIRLAERELSLVGRVCWSRAVTLRLAPAASQPLYRSGVAFLEGQSFKVWDRLLAGLLSPAARRARRLPRRRVVKWRPLRVQDAESGLARGRWREL